MTAQPRRIRLSRARGGRKPADTINVARGPGRRWGNPHRLGVDAASRAQAVDLYPRGQAGG